VVAEDGGDVADLVAGGGGDGEPRGVMAVAGLEADALLLAVRRHAQGSEPQRGRVLHVAS
jgi:hypothetical protein